MRYNTLVTLIATFALSSLSNAAPTAFNKGLELTSATHNQDVSSLLTNYQKRESEEDTEEDKEKKSDDEEDEETSEAETSDYIDFQHQQVADEEDEDSFLLKRALSLDQLSRLTGGVPALPGASGDDDEGGLTSILKGLLGGVSGTGAGGHDLTNKLTNEADRYVDDSDSGLL
ncbi:MAG: hypothetical protein EXX96DRAFT_574674 [Benjaminiella poitrasii]|nr:MAG: hypothetical protein EXX96DRAFT_574674 [Benjaminiella poitrasii]